MADPDLVRAALDDAIGHAGLEPMDRAAVALARAYADAIDGDEGQLVRLGPAMLATLTALGMTPGGRRSIHRFERPEVEPSDSALVPAPTTPPAAANELDLLRQARAERARGVQ